MGRQPEDANLQTQPTGQKWVKGNGLGHTLTHQVLPKHITVLFPQGMETEHCSGEQNVNEEIILITEKHSRGFI